MAAKRKVSAKGTAPKAKAKAGPGKGSSPSSSYFRKSKAERSRSAPTDPRHWGAKCDLCPLRGSTTVFGEGPEAPQLAIIGANPGHAELDTGIPFVGRPGQFLEEKLALHGLTRRQVFLDHALACFPPGGDLKLYLQRSKKEFKADQKTGVHAKDAVFHSPIDCCRPRLLYALGVPRCGTCLRWDLEGDDVKCMCKTPKWVKSKFPRIPVVVPTENAALEALTGDDGIKSKMNYVFKVKERAR